MWLKYFFSLRKDKKKKKRNVFLHTSFFFNSQSHGGCYGILKLKKYFLFEKICATHQQMNDT
jgi:hypothetical protein